MKGITLLIVGLVFLAVGILLPRVLVPGSPAAVYIALLRIPGIICFLIALLRLSRESRARKKK